MKTNTICSIKEKNQEENVNLLISQSTGKLSMLRNLIAAGNECLCSGNMHDATVNILEEIESSLYKVQDFIVKEGNRE